MISSKINRIILAVSLFIISTFTLTFFIIDETKRVRELEFNNIGHTGMLYINNII